MSSLKCLTQEGEGTSVASTGGFHLIKLITLQVVKECMSVLNQLMSTLSSSGTLDPF